MFACASGWGDRDAGLAESLPPLAGVRDVRGIRGQWLERYGPALQLVGLLVSPASHLGSSTLS